METSMFQVSLVNFGVRQDFDTLAYACAFATRACFEAVIRRNGVIIARFSPISGWTGETA
jgi:hypothetical protein